MVIPVQSVLSLQVHNPHTIGHVVLRGGNLLQTLGVTPLQPDCSLQLDGVLISGRN